MSKRDTWMLACTGPSRGQHPPRLDTMNATVNGGRHPSLPNPHGAQFDAVGIFEIKAAMHWGRGLRKGIRTFLRPQTQQILDLPAPVIIGSDFGPAPLLDLHDDVHIAPEEPGIPNYGQFTVWIGSGALMLWIIAELYRPKRILVSGLDGYPEDPANSHLDYAGELKQVTANLDHLPYRRQRFNERASEGIRRITNHYTGTDFIWLAKPNLDTTGWRYTIGE